MADEVTPQDIVGGVYSASGITLQDGQGAALQLTGDGALIVSTITSQGNSVRGSGTTSAGSATEVIPAPAAGTYIYVTSMQLTNTSATAVTVTLNDTVSSTFIVPNGGGNNAIFTTPLKVTASGTHLTFTASTGVPSITCNAQGYTGP